MPALEEWFKIVAMCLDAICLVAAVTMNMRHRSDTFSRVRAVVVFGN